MGQNQQCQTKGTSSKTMRNKLRMALSQHIAVPKFCKDTSRVCNHWNKHSHCQTGSIKYIHCTFPVEMLLESTGTGVRVKNLTETKSKAQAVLGPAAVHISAVNMSCSYTFSWGIKIAKSSQDKITCMYFHVLAVLSSGKNKPAAVNFSSAPTYPGEFYYSQKSSVQTVTRPGREIQGSLSPSGTVHFLGHSCLKPRIALLCVVRGTWPAGQALEFRQCSIPAVISGTVPWSLF